MDFEEKIILMLSSGLVGVLASVITIGIKERLDRIRPGFGTCSNTPALQAAHRAGIGR